MIWIGFVATAMIALAGGQGGAVGTDPGAAPPVPNPAIVVPPMPGDAPAAPTRPVVVVAPAAPAADAPRAADPPVQVAPVPPTTVPPAPPTTVTTFQRPPAPPSVLPSAPGEAPDDPFQEPPISPFLPQRPFAPEDVLPDGTRVNLPTAAPQYITYGPRYGNQTKFQYGPSTENPRRFVATGGLIVKIVYQGKTIPSPNPLAPPIPVYEEVELGADNAVGWIHGAKAEDLGGDGPPPQTKTDDKTEVELYLQGNVVIRTMSEQQQGVGKPPQKMEQVLRAQEIYYDVSKSKALAICGNMELNVMGFPDNVRLKADEIWQLGKNEYRMFRNEVSSSKRQTDPGLKMTTRQSVLTSRTAVRRNIFGFPYRNLKTGETEVGFERILTSQSVFVRIFDTPIFWEPRNKTDVNEPMGPLKSLSFGNDQIFGVQLYLTWDMYKLLGVRPGDNSRWLLHTDYLSLRGPAFGSDYDYSGPDLFGFGRQQAGFFRFYGIDDEHKLEGGQDNLGGDRGPEPFTPHYRGRVQWRHTQDLYEDGTTYVRANGQIEYLSDKNYLEQYYNQEYNTMPNQETFMDLYGAKGNTGGSLLFEQNLARPWVTETNWLPKADGYMIGQNLFDVATYNAKASVAYGQLRPASIYPVPVGQGVVNPQVANNLLITNPSPQDVADSTGRLDFMQKLDAPFDLGPFRIDPYGIVDMTYYSQDLAGKSRDRFYGGGGVRESFTVSRLYDEVYNELFNVHGLYHKSTWSANFYAAHSDTSYTLLPQMDRLNDDATDYEHNLVTPREQTLTDANGRVLAGGYYLSNSPVFDPQLLAIRRLVLDRVDTLDSIQELQLSTNQRLQTKRGFPGAEHTVDWMTLDMSMALFPNANRDNFGQAAGMFEYKYLWHIGDRTSISSNGWYDPRAFGNGLADVRYADIGLNFTRPDGTLYQVTYRYTDPIDSRALQGSITYAMSRRYKVSFSTSYDFGLNQAQTIQMTFLRTGADMTAQIGFSYNAIQQNFGFQIAFLPNLALAQSPNLLSGAPVLSR